MMANILDVAATLFAGDKTIRGSLDECLDRFKILGAKEQLRAMLVVDGKLYASLPPLNWRLEGVDIKHALEQREAGELHG